MSGLFHSCFRLVNSLHDVGVSRAAAEVAAHILADVGVGTSVSLLHARDRRYDLPRRAIATLERVVIDKGLLHRVERPVRLRQAFNRGDVSTVDRSSQSQA